MGPEDQNLEDEDFSLDPPEDSEDAPETGEQEPEEQQTDEQPEGQLASDLGQEPPQRQPSRAERRFQTLTGRLSDMERRNQDLERRLNESLVRSQAPRQESPEERAQRLALLTPEEQMREHLRESDSRHAQQITALQVQLMDGQDRASFEAKSLADPRYKRFSARVEAELAALRTKGMNIPRENLMFYLAGKDYFERAMKETGRQRQEAQQRVNRQRSQPGNSRSDVGNQRRTTSTDSRERRLADVPL